MILKFIASISHLYLYLFLYHHDHKFYCCYQRTLLVISWLTVFIDGGSRSVYDLQSTPEIIIKVARA